MINIFNFNRKTNYVNCKTTNEEINIIDAETEELNMRKYFSRHSSSHGNESREIYTSIPTTNLCIINLSNRAGSTFISLNLAKAISQSKIAVSVIEAPIGNPYIYDCLGIENKLSNFKNKDDNSFYSYTSEINRGYEIDKDKDINHDGINWIITNPNHKKIDNWNSVKMMKLLTAKKNVGVNIIDCGNNFEHESIQEILSLMDMVLVVIDPLPSEIMINEKKLDRNNICKNKSIRVEYIINRWNDGVDKKELLEYIAVNPIAYIPFIDPEKIYRAIYKCEIPYVNEEIKQQLNNGLQSVINEIIPENYMEK